MTNETFHKLKATALKNGIKRMIVRYGDGWVALEIPRGSMTCTKAHKVFGPIIDSGLEPGDYFPFILVGKLNFFRARIKKFQLINGGLRPLGG